MFPRFDDAIPWKKEMIVKIKRNFIYFLHKFLDQNLVN